MPTLPKLDWQTVNTDTMPANIAKAYTAYRKTVEATNAERAKLEEMITAHLQKQRKIPAGQEPRYGYRWGKLAIAFSEPSQGKTAGSGELFTFS